MGNFHSADPVEYTIATAPTASTPSKATDENEKAGRSLIYKAVSHPDELVATLVGEKMDNAYDIFARGLAISRNAPMLGRRYGTGPYEWWTYGEVEAMALLLGTGLLRSKLVEEQSFPNEAYEPARKLKMIGMYSKNRVEWFVTEQAANAYGLTLIPLYDTLGDDAVLFILGQSRMQCVACSLECAEKLVDLLERQTNRTDFLKALLLFDKPTDELQKKAADLKIELQFWITVMEENKLRGVLPIAVVSTDAVSTICYTSGTTGNPKGAILTHRMFASTVAAAIRGPLSDPRLKLKTSDTHISYLPLAHVFERAICNLVLSLGARIGVYSGDNLKLLDDVKMLQPTIFISVPRLYMRINDKIVSGIKTKSSLAQFLITSGLSAKINRIHRKADPTDPLWDALVFNKVKDLLGGKVRFMLVGGAPLDSLVQDRMAALFCAHMLEGYGLTETLGATCIKVPHDPTSGHVGGMLACDEFVLESVPEMNYSVHDEMPRGELLIRGHSVSPGYFGAPELTKEAYTSDGFFRTGDIAVVLPGGALKLIDRKKNLFKLAQGEYIAPERVEGIYGQAELVGQIWVYGEPRRSALVGIVCPDEEAAHNWSKANGCESMSLEQLCASEAFMKATMDSMKTVEGTLKGFEKVKLIHLTHEAMSVENGMLTPTFKIKRFEAKKVFADEIERMYESLEKLEQNKGGREGGL